MKQKLIESVEATRSYFKDKRCTALDYMEHLEKELRVRDCDKMASELKYLILEKVKAGGI